jgi:2-polyprenyl-6-hydroxyphenyl methylase/3-demethylubiquinone-9 3-methyltransferase
VIRKLISWNLRLSRACDRLIFKDFAIDGNGAFNQLAPSMVKDGSRVADVGGGKTPFFPTEAVRQRELRVTGVDIDAAELDLAPLGAYADVIVSALEKCRGAEDHDIVIAQSVLEHVYDGREAMRGIASLLRPGGTVITFCPNRRAWFARLNVLLPEGLKRAILFAVFPSKRERQGFPAHYDGCTPAEMQENMRLAKIRPVEIKYYFVSSYFMFFAPLYLFWRLATYPLMRFWPHRYCETFIVVGRREGDHGESKFDA